MLDAPSLHWLAHSLLHRTFWRRFFPRSLFMCGLCRSGFSSAGVFVPCRARILEKHPPAQRLETVSPEIARAPVIGFIEKYALRVVSFRSELIRDVAKIEVAKQAIE